MVPVYPLGTMGKIIIKLGDQGGAVAKATAAEWVLGNGLGGFAMGTAAGIPTRRYHGWLVAATAPPIGRVMGLVGAAETLVLLPGAARTGGEEANNAVGSQGEGTRIDLSTFRFASASGGGGGVLSPRGVDHLTRFERDDSEGGVCRWEYTYGPVRVRRELSMVPGVNATRVRWRIKTGGHAARLEVRPLVALRDFHGPLVYAGDPSALPRVAVEQRAVRVDRGPLSLVIEWDSTGGAGWRFIEGADWWYGFEYVREAERGLDCHEDLYCPGMLSATLPSFPGVTGDDLEHSVELAVTGWSREGVGTGAIRPKLSVPSVCRAAAKARVQAIVTNAMEGRSKWPEPTRDATAMLTIAADQFVVRREGVSKASSPVETWTSVIAGYPWFGDWGRDTMIALPGLFLATRRYAEARRVLETFAGFALRGVVPNCFDDATREPMYNTVDGSLWYLHAACEYLRRSGDRAGFDGVIRAACLDIIESYRNGTDYGIRMDADGLVAAGDPSVALTWMDAKRDGTVFTPRTGKPVEIQALWYSGLLEVASSVEASDAARASELRQMASLTGQSIRGKYWDNARQCLHDGLSDQGLGGWHADPAIRPNQIFAVSQPHSALPIDQQRAVVACVRERLLTPMGVRTLDPRDSRYLGRYRGTLFERDRAYHNGTAWPWLIGPYVRALVRSADDKQAARATARTVIEPLASSLCNGTAIGSLTEIFDGDAGASGEHRPDGCMAQAWSVAEVLDALVMINE